MEAHVANRAVLVLRVGHIVKRGRQRNARSRSSRASSVVAFQAQSEDHGALEQSRVGRTVWLMARLAALHAHRGVLEHERTTQVFVAAETGLFIHARLRHHPRTVAHLPGRRESPVRVVAVAAVHETFVDAVLEGH